MTMTDLCNELNNYFCLSKHFGDFVISAGTLLSCNNFLAEGQYFRIVDSTFNDGVYQYPASSLTDETFSGAVWAMAVPPAVIALQAEIATWEKANQNALDSPYQSESFGGYSYSKASGTDGSSLTWQSFFKSRLNEWRKIR